jgi:hypothetical protein
MTELNFAYPKCEIEISYTKKKFAYPKCEIEISYTKKKNDKLSKNLTKIQARNNRYFGTITSGLSHGTNIADLLVQESGEWVPGCENREITGNRTNGIYKCAKKWLQKLSHSELSL